LNPTVIPPLTGVNRGNSQSTVSSSGIPENKIPAAHSPSGSENKLLLFAVNGHRGLDLQAKDAGDVFARASLETVPTPFSRSRARQRR
jgi:hypothetical protein